MHSLIESNRESILSLAQKNGVRNIRVFGSMTGNDVRPDSDVDFLVELEDGKTGLALGGFQMDVSELLNRKVDVLTEKALHPKIHANIVREATPL